MPTSSSSSLIAYVVTALACWRLALAIPDRDHLKEFGLSEAVVDYGPSAIQPMSESWCDQMERDQDWFVCDDGEDPWCVHPYLRCNNVHDCQDGSDENYCQENAPPQDSRPTTDYCYQCTALQRKLLQHHNAFREQERAANMNELNWSKDAEMAAMEQARLCAVPEWGDNPHGNMHPDYGQNVARYYYPGELTDDQVLDMVTWWYDERKDYDYERDSCVTGAMCGHYLTLVSAYERNLGCALQRCDRSHSGEQRTFWNLVCNYGIWPNWKVWTTHPEQPYIEGDQCTKCQPGLVCRQFLCA